MAAWVLCKEINELFLESVVELLFGRASQFTEGGDTSRVAMSPIVSTACAYGSLPNGGDTARIVEPS